MAGTCRERTGGGFAVFLPISDWKIYPRQLGGLSQVGLHPDWVNLGLRGGSLNSSEGSLKKWTADLSLGWVGFGQREALSKTTKLILLDSLLQEVCIKSGLAGCSPLSSLRLSVCLVQSQSFFLQD